MIAALYVETDGAYFGLPGVEPWDEAKDARSYAGVMPVVAHPPCQRWGKLWAGQPLWIARTGERKKKGDDGGCFESALASVRKNGGVLEHPWGSHAWPHFGLTVPPRTGGWVKADEFGGFTCCVEQGQYGHYARKPTLLYAVGVDLPELRWGENGACFPAVGNREIRHQEVQAGRRTGLQGWRHKQHATDSHADRVSGLAAEYRANGGVI